MMQGQNQPVSGNKNVQVGKVDGMDHVDAQSLELVGHPLVVGAALVI